VIRVKLRARHRRGLGGRPRAGEGATRHRRRPSRSAPCVASRARRRRPAQDHQPIRPTASHRAGSRSCSPLHEDQPAGEHPWPYNRQSLQRRAQQLDDWHRTPSPALGLLGDQAAAAWVRLPPNGQQPTNEVDVTHLQSGHLSDPQCCRRQDHHAVTPGPITTPLHGFRDQPAQRAHVRQGGADRPTTRRPSPILRQGCAPAARRAPPRPAPALGPRSCS
jgi:hypothetical protein